MPMPISVTVNDMLKMFRCPIAKVTTLRDQGKSLDDVLAANLTAPYDKTTLGDTPQSKARFITEVYDEASDFPPIVDGKRTMPRRP